MKNQKVSKNKHIRSESDLKSLAEQLKQSFSFQHKTIAEAKKAINAGIYTYVFDATTLYRYESNLNSTENGILDELLNPFYQKLRDTKREAYKELNERRTLLWFLLSSPDHYQNSIIEKTERPDFILTGEKRVGVEVTELTTQYDKDVQALSSQIIENNIHSEEKVLEHIQRYHKTIADRVAYKNIVGTSEIYTDCYCLDSNRIHYSEEIKKKHGKYKNEIGEYDEFIILCDAASGSGLEISEEAEVKEVIKHLLTICPEIIDTTVAIAWREARNQKKIIYSWYLNQ